MTVRAKFKVRRLELSEDYSSKEILTTIVMEPVFGNKDDPTNENGQFFKYTPSGEVKLGTINPTAAEYFEIGALYYLDFTKA